MDAKYKYLSKTVNYYPLKSQRAPAPLLDTKSRIQPQPAH